MLTLPYEPYCDQASLKKYIAACALGPIEKHSVISRLRHNAAAAMHLKYTQVKGNLEKGTGTPCTYMRHTTAIQTVTQCTLTAHICCSSLTLYMGTSFFAN